ncbi:MAG: class I SAM-dependent methyltransferase [Pirellulales bacterium]|nr:class I SAM-dependent methyltransferase [Pirellulales bacterium]
MTVPDWQLPAGVTRGAWDYFQARHIARDYDQYFADCPLFDVDSRLLARYFSPPGVVADFGCGTGRALLPLIHRGHTGLAIDLSEEMLAVVAEKAAAEQLPVRCVRGNLVELPHVSDNAADYGMCLFSTLGMIQGRENRQRALLEMRRILRPGGILILHVHNVWFNLYDPAGPGWVLGSWLRSCGKGDYEFGDKVFPYRQIPAMFLHVFPRREILSTVRQAGLQIIEFIPLGAPGYQPLRWGYFLQELRASGWLIVCQKSV